MTMHAAGRQPEKGENTVGNGNDLPLITSLVPRLSRMGSGGQDIGGIYQKYCVESWLRAGFPVYSLNTGDEIACLKHDYLDVHFIEAPRDGRAQVGRPLVFIADMVTALRDRGYAQCGLINSDIYLRPAPSLIDVLRREIPGSCVFGHRFDVARVGDAAGAVYWGGFDFFFLETASFDDETFAPFLQGVPWWDYGLPLMQAIKGMDLKRLDTPLFCHLLHEQRWDMTGWRDFYAVVRRMLTDLAIKAVGVPELNSMLDVKALRHLLGEGAFIAGHFSSAYMTQESRDQYITAFVFHCLDMISSMSSVLRLPVDAEQAGIAPDHQRHPTAFAHCAGG